MKNQATFLFNHFCKNLNDVCSHPGVTRFPERNDIVICPLCFNQYFTIDDLNAKKLTLEHAPPGKLKGKVVALTCKDCNNDRKRNLDSDLVQFMHELNAINGNRKSFIDGEVKTDTGSKVRVNFQYHANTFVIHPIQKASSQLSLDSLHSQFERGIFPKMNVILKLVHPRRAKLALLRIAYLLAFSHLGYSFLLNENIARVRHQLQHPEEDIFPGQAIHIYDASVVPDAILGVNIANIPSLGKCFFIVFDLDHKSGISRRASVLLPGPNPSDNIFFDSLSVIENTNEEAQVTHYNISFEEKLQSPFLTYEIWDEN